MILRIIKWGLIGITSVLSLIVITLSLVVGTESGRLWLVDLGKSFAKKAGIELQVNQLRTPSLGEWSADDFQISRDNNILVTGSNIILRWSPSALLKRQLLIEEIHSSQLDYFHAHPTKEEPEEEQSPSSPITQPPGSLVLRKLNIERLTLNNIVIREHALPAYRLSGSAEAFTSDYPLSLQLDITSIDSDETHLQIQSQAVSTQRVRIQGNLAEAPNGLIGGLIQWPAEQSIDAQFALELFQEESRFDLVIEAFTLPLSGHTLKAEGNISYDMPQQWLKVPELLLWTDGNRHKIQGAYSKLDAWAQIHLNQLPLDIVAPWVEDLKGGFVTGHLQANWLHSDKSRWPDVVANLKSSVHYQDMQIAASIEGELKNKQLQLKPSSVRLATTELKAQGHIDFEGDKSDVHGELLNFDTALLQPWNLPIPETLSASADKTTFAVKGSIQNPSVYAETLVQGAYQDAAFTVDVQSNATLQNAALQRLIIRTQNSEIQAQGQIDWTGSSNRLTIQLKNLDQSLLQYAPESVAQAVPKDFTFNVNGTVKVTGALARAKVQTDTLIKGLYGLITENGKKETVPYQVTVQGSAQAGNLDQLLLDLGKVEIAVFDKPALTLHGQYRAQKMDLTLSLLELPTQILAALGMQRIDGQAEGTIQFAGSLKKPLINGHLEYQDTLPGRERQRVPVSLRLDMSTIDDDFSLQAIFKHHEEQAGSLTLSLPLDVYLQPQTQSSTPLYLDVLGQWDLRILRLFADLGSHRIEGRIETDFKIRGQLNKPELIGTIQLLEGTYNNPATGTLLEHIRLTLEGEGETLLIKDGEARSGESGHLSLEGKIHWQEDKRQDPDAISATLSLRDVTLLQRRDLQGDVGGNVSVKGSFEEIWVKGEVEIAPLHASVDSAITTSIPEIDVREIRDENKNASSSQLPIIHLDVAIVAERQAYLRGRGLDTELGGRIFLQGTADKPIYRGTFHTRRGRIDLFGKRFVLQNGEVNFNNDGVILRIPAVYTGTDGSSITAELYGTADAPKLKLSSVPARPDDEILSYLIFGKSVQEITPFQAVRLAAAVRSLSSGGGFDPVDSARQMLGVDTLTIDNSSEGNNSGVSVGVGKYLNEKVYLEVKRSPNPAQPWQGSVQIEISPKLTLQSGTSENGGAGAELLWKRDY